MSKLITPALVLLSVIASWAEEGPVRTLRHDPFARPALDLPKSAPTRRAHSGTAPQRQPLAQATRAKQPAPEPRWEPKLHGTLMAGPGSVANVDGIILSLGEKIEGRRLIEIREREVIFVKGKTKVLISMDRESTVLTNSRTERQGRNAGPPSNKSDQTNLGEQSSIDPRRPLSSQPDPQPGRREQGETSAAAIGTSSALLDVKDPATSLAGVKTFLQSILRGSADTNPTGKP